MPLKEMYFCYSEGGAMPTSTGTLGIFRHAQLELAACRQSPQLPVVAVASTGII